MLLSDEAEKNVGPENEDCVEMVDGLCVLSTTESDRISGGVGADIDALWLL